MNQFCLNLLIQMPAEDSKLTRKLRRDFTLPPAQLDDLISIKVAE